VVDCERTACASPFRLEAVETVPAADVEHRSSCEAILEVDVGQLVENVELGDAGAEDAVAEVDLVEPGQGVDALLEFYGHAAEGTISRRACGCRKPRKSDSRSVSSARGKWFEPF
jgi:hypothetical protein